MARKDKEGHKATTDKYPTPKKGEKIDCLGCRNSQHPGLVLVRAPNVFDKCTACRGKGYFIA